MGEQFVGRLPIAPGPIEVSDNRRPAWIDAVEDFADCLVLADFTGAIELGLGHLFPKRRHKASQGRGELVSGLAGVGRHVIIENGAAIILLHRTVGIVGKLQGLAEPRGHVGRRVDHEFAARLDEFRQRHDASVARREVRGQHDDATPAEVALGDGFLVKRVGSKPDSLQHDLNPVRSLLGDGQLGLGARLRLDRDHQGDVVPNCGEPAEADAGVADVLAKRPPSRQPDAVDLFPAGGSALDGERGFSKPQRPPALFSDRLARGVPTAAAAEVERQSADQRGVVDGGLQHESSRCTEIEMDAAIGNRAEQLRLRGKRGAQPHDRTILLPNDLDWRGAFVGRPNGPGRGRIGVMEVVQNLLAA